MAKRAGVSTATVSNVINSTKFVKKDTRERVREAMEELNYRPNIVAKTLKGKDAKVIGFIMPILKEDISAEFFLSMSNGIESILTDEGYELIISNSRESHKNEMNQIDMYRSGSHNFVDGLIVAPASVLEKDSIKQFNFQLPIVFVDRKPDPLSEYNTVYTDNYSITYQAIEMMTKKKRKKIAFVSGPIDISSVIDRLKAYKNVLKDNNIHFNNDLVFIGEPSFESGYNIAKNIIRQHEIDGIITVNNTMSMGVFKCLKDNKFIIPDEVSFLSYDDFRWMELTEPTITTIRQPAFEMGKAAAKILLEKIKTSNKENKEICIESIIVDRNSL